MLTKVSDNLIAALGPTTFGVLLGNKFYTTSDFVANHIFRYALTGGKKTSSSGNSENPRDPLDIEIHPQINDSILYADKDIAFRSYATYGVVKASLRGGGINKKTKKLKKFYYQLDLGFSEGE